MWNFRSENKEMFVEAWTVSDINDDLKKFGAEKISFDRIWFSVSHIAFVWLEPFRLSPTRLIILKNFYFKVEHDIVSTFSVQMWQ